EYEEHFAEEHVEHSTALHSRLRATGGAYLVGPIARWALGGDRLSDVAREAADAVGLERVVTNPFRSIVVRAVEILYALDESPRGMLWHRYRIDEDGTILDAKIVPPTSQNQARIEETLHGVVERHMDLEDDALRVRAESAIRSYDPCISCSAHFLRLTVDRG